MLNSGPRLRVCLIGGLPTGNRGFIVFECVFSFTLLSYCLLGILEHQWILKN